jgi:hypothetical protein
MYRLFTLTEATRLLPVVDEHLGVLQGAAADVTRLRERLSDLSATSIEANNLGKEVAFLLGVIHGSKAELDRLGVQIRDVEEGLVDFPSQLGAEVVCLTWEKGQDAITHYHALSGDTAARPLPPGLEATSGSSEARRAGSGSA